MQRSFSPQADSALPGFPWRAFGPWLARHWQKGLLLALAFYIVLKKDVAINLQMNGGPHQEIAAMEKGLLPIRSGKMAAQNPEASTADRANPSLLQRLSAWFGMGPASPQKYQASEVFAFEPRRAREDGAHTLKRQRQLQYIDRYLDIARQERDRYGIPASITLAQGLLESNAGQSTLATRNNNHFGIKCFSRSCDQGHCRNFSDDHHKDFFRAYENPWESYRAHSLLLQKKRYRHLKKLDPGDYKGWAKGLQRAGYATDPRYADKLIFLIESLGLDRLDRPAAG